MDLQTGPAPLDTVPGRVHHDRHHRHPFVWEKAPHGADAVTIVRPVRTVAGLAEVVAA